MKISDREFACRLKGLRRNRKMTQIQLAGKMRVSRTCITNWEKGERLPGYENIVELSRFFEVPIDYLYGRCNHKYNINIPEYFELDLSRLNSDGLNRICEYYEFLVKDEKFCK